MKKQHKNIEKWNRWTEHTVEQNDGAGGDSCWETQRKKTHNFQNKTYRTPLLNGYLNFWDRPKEETEEI